MWKSTLFIRFSLSGSRCMSDAISSRKLEQMGSYFWRADAVCEQRCDRRRELRKRRFEPEGSEKYREVNNNIKRCMKKAKENWIGEQCSEIEENLGKNNSKRAYQLVKDLTTLKQGKATTVQDHSGKCLTEEREILNWWTEYCTGLYNHEASGDPSVLNRPQTNTVDDHLEA